jgi:uncharacterized protein
MPAALSYPGVYIEEIPSGVRTIVGVATSITAFLGRAANGPANDPVLINSFADFERRFGGLGANYPMSYAVRDFYLNGGTQAIIVRLFKPSDGSGFALLSVGALTFRAAYPGEWGRKLRARVEMVDPASAPEVQSILGLQPADSVFNLTITRPGGVTEQLRSLSVKDSPRRLDKVLEAESNLLRWKGDWPAVVPSVTADSDAAGKAEKALADAQKSLTDTKKATTPPDPAKVAAAEKAVADAQKSLDDAKKTTPPDPTKITAAEKAVTDAQKSLDDAETATNASNSQNLTTGGDFTGVKNDKTGLYALEKADLFNLLCIPADTRGGDTPQDVYQAAMQYCTDRRAMLLVDSPAKWSKVKETAAGEAAKGLPDLGLSGVAARNAALYFPRLIEFDPNNEGRPDVFVPCGAVAGVMARTDVQRGVWKAPAGLDAALNGISGLEVNLTDLENGMLNPLGINCFRSFAVNGRVVWGARTLRGADQLADEYKYVPVRRLALFIEESLYRGTQWVVFEPNDEPLWAQIRLNVGAFMHNLFRQGAFQGTTPRDAYFVKCDKETTTQNDINLGIVNIVVGFAPLKPAEFVVIKLQQMAGQIET